MAHRTPWNKSSDAYVFDKTCQPQVLLIFPSFSPSTWSGDSSAFDFRSSGLPHIFDVLSAESAAQALKIRHRWHKVCKTPSCRRFFGLLWRPFLWICCRSAPPPATDLRHTHRTHTPHTLHTPSVSLPTRIPLQPQTSESHPLLEDILADSANIFEKVFHAFTRRLSVEYF